MTCLCRGASSRGPGSCPPPAASAAAPAPSSGAPPPRAPWPPCPPAWPRRRWRRAQSWELALGLCCRRRLRPRPAPLPWVRCGASGSAWASEWDLREGEQRKWLNEGGDRDGGVYSEVLSGDVINPKSVSRWLKGRGTAALSAAGSKQTAGVALRAKTLTNATF